MIGPNFPALLEAFFTDRLISQRRSSPHTVSSYRDTFRLLLAVRREGRRQATRGAYYGRLDGQLHRALPRWA